MLKAYSMHAAAQSLMPPHNWNVFRKRAAAQNVQGRPLYRNGFPKHAAAQNRTLLPVCLEAQDLPLNKKVYVEFTLRALDQYNNLRMHEKVLSFPFIFIAGMSRLTIYFLFFT